MDIAFATNDAFCGHTAVAIYSLMACNRTADITIHLLTIGCRAENIDKIRCMVEKKRRRIKVYEVSETLFACFPPTGCYSLASYLRLCLPSLLKEVDKVLYMDSDVVVNGDIRDLWNTDISACPVAALFDATLSYEMVKDYIGYDYFKDGYFNSGVLLMNLGYWRTYKLQEKMFDYLKSHSVKLPDQDALNAVLHGTIKPLHPKWNCHVGYFAFPPLVVSAQRKYIKELWTGAKIIHFTGPAKPWYRECVNPYKHLYLKYKRMTPWRDKPLLRLEDSAWKSMRIIFLRKCKNVVARLVSYTYK